jgi:hypothetical protein
MPERRVIVRAPGGTVLEFVFSADEPLGAVAELLSHCARQVSDLMRVLDSAGNGTPEGSASVRPCGGPEADRQRRARALLAALVKTRKPELSAEQLAAIIGLSGPRGLGPVFVVLKRMLISAGVAPVCVARVVHRRRARDASWWAPGPDAESALACLGGGEINTNTGGADAAQTTTEPVTA